LLIVLSKINKTQQENSSSGMSERWHPVSSITTKNRISSLRNTGKQMISFMAIDLCQEIPYKFKDLHHFAFYKSIKNYLPSQQYQRTIPQFF